MSLLGKSWSTDIMFFHKSIHPRNPNVMETKVRKKWHNEKYKKWKKNRFNYKYTVYRFIYSYIHEQIDRYIDSDGYG